MAWPAAALLIVILSLALWLGIGALAMWLLG
jgi:hypothetical protein